MGMVRKMVERRFKNVNTEEGKEVTADIKALRRELDKAREGR